MTRLEKWVLEEMVEHLEDMEDMEGQRVYGSDLGFALFESENCSGSYTCSAHAATQWIKEYFEDLGAAVEDYQNEYGTYPKNPFRDPETFQVQIILYISSCLIEKYWDDTVELTLDTIAKIMSDWHALL